MNDEPYAMLEAVLFIECHPELSFRIDENERLIVSPVEAAREKAPRIRELKSPLLDVIGQAWTHHRASLLVGQMHRYVTHVVLAKEMVETLEYVDGALGEADSELKKEQHALEAAIDEAAAEKDWEALRKHVAGYVAFWQRVHGERIESELSEAA